MGIELSISDPQPAVNRNRVFLTRLEITQAHQPDDGAVPLYKVTLEYRRYGVDANGQRSFATESREIVIKDFIAHGMDRLSAGDARLIQALQAIEGAVAAIVADDLGTTANVI